MQYMNNPVMDDAVPVQYERHSSMAASMAFPAPMMSIRFRRPCKFNHSHSERHCQVRKQSAPGHFNNEVDFAGSDGLVSMNIDNIKPRQIFSSLSLCLSFCPDLLLGRAGLSGLRFVHFYLFRGPEAFAYLVYLGVHLVSSRPP